MRILKITVLLIIIISSYIPSKAQYPVGTWNLIASFPGTPRAFASAFSIDTLGYVGLGFDTAFDLDFWVYYPDSNLWHQADSFPGTGRSSAFSFSNDSAGWGFIGSGYIGGASYQDDLWRYNQASNTWTMLNIPNNSLSRSEAVGLAIGTTGYVTTGVTSPDVDLNDTWNYNMLTDSWTSDASFGGLGRYAAAGFTIGSTIYAGTGINDSMYFNDFWSFNPTAHTWTQEADFEGTARFGAVGFSLGGFGFIGLGQDLNTSYRQDFWLYDPNQNLWTFVAHFPSTGRKYAVAFTISDSVAYVGTGKDSSGNTSDFWQFTADTTAGINDIKTKISISVYPNPNNGVFQLNYNLSGLNNAEFRIADATGKQIATYTLSASENNMTIDQSGLKNGIYYYYIENSDRTLNVGKICILK